MSGFLFFCCILRPVMQEAMSAGIPVPGGACEDTSRIMTFRYAAVT